MVYASYRSKVVTPQISHIPPNLVVECVPTHRKPPEVRICRLSIQSAVGTGRVRLRLPPHIGLRAGSCTSSLRLIRQPDRPDTIPSFELLYEGVLLWSLLSFS